VQTLRSRGRTGAHFFAIPIIVSQKDENQMVRSTAIEIIARRLALNAGRVAALAQRAAEAGELPKAVGRSVPDLAPIGLARLLICAICDRGLGNAATSVREFAALATEGGAKLIDLLEGLMSGGVSAAGLHSAIVQVFPEPSVTVVLHDSRLQFGPERSQDGASHTIVIQGDALRAIIDEFRGNALHPAPPRATPAFVFSATAHSKAV
jgi:hypothetical protein